MLCHFGMLSPMHHSVCKLVDAIHKGLAALSSFIEAAGEADQECIHTIGSIGGQAPDSFAVTSGKLPNGLSLNTATGAITGVPISAGTFCFTIQVTDTDDDPGSVNIQIIVKPNPSGGNHGWVAQSNQDSHVGQCQRACEMQSLPFSQRLRKVSNAAIAIGFQTGAVPIVARTGR